MFAHRSILVILHILCFLCGNILMTRNQRNPTKVWLNVDNNYRNMRLRLNNQRGTPPQAETVRQGRVEVSFDNGGNWGTICSTNWTLREANVVCRQLNLGFAAYANQTIEYGNSKKHPLTMVGTLCRGSERRLSECMRESQYPQACNGDNRNVAVVGCIPKIADLQLNLRDIEISLRLQSVALSELTCAMEENCLASDAYDIVDTQPHAKRDLLRFTTTAENVGDADFSPYANFLDWEWHQCHQHFHSMNVFSTFDIYDLNYKKVADGHKASFCLMDSVCRPGITPRHTCGNTTQGISVGCSDIYSSQLDCQWVDVTNLARNRFYILRLTINPEYKIGEKSFENNAAECLLQFTGLSGSTRIVNCARAPLWFHN